MPSQYLVIISDESASIEMLPIIGVPEKFMFPRQLVMFELLVNIKSRTLLDLATLCKIYNDCKISANLFFTNVATTCQSGLCINLILGTYPQSKIQGLALAQVKLWGFSL